MWSHSPRWPWLPLTGSHVPSVVKGISVLPTGGPQPEIRCLTRLRMFLCVRINNWETTFIGFTDEMNHS